MERDRREVRTRLVLVVITRQALSIGHTAMEAGNLRGNLIIEDERMEQQKLMAEQDDLMGEIGQSVDRLAVVSKDMNAELRAQNA